MRRSPRVLIVLRGPGPGLERRAGVSEVVPGPVSYPTTCLMAGGVLPARAGAEDEKAGCRSYDSVPFPGSGQVDLAALVRGFGPLPEYSTSGGAVNSPSANGPAPTHSRELRKPIVSIGRTQGSWSPLFGPFVTGVGGLPGASVR